MADDAIVRIQSIDDQWEQIGTGSWAGFWPEGITATSNKWGSDTLSFTIKRDPRVGGAFRLNAFAPIELEVAGVVVWEGYLWETPTNVAPGAVSVSVTARGEQYALDDFPYSRVYAQTDLGIWSDVRSAPTATLSRFPQALTVSSGDGTISIGAAKDSVWPNADAVGVVADFGENPKSWITDIAIEVARVGSFSAGGDIYVRAADDISDLILGAAGTFGDFISGTAASTLQDQATGFDTLTGSIATPRRYVSIFLYNAAADYTAAADTLMMIKSVRAFSDSSYVSSGDSVLHADQIVKDALTYQDVISQSTTDIEATTFAIPDFTVTEPKTVREVIEAANAFHAYRTKIVPGSKLKFAPQPSAPALEASDEPGSEFADASANVAEELFNKVYVTGTGPDGNSLMVTRTTQQSALATQLVAPLSPSFANDVFNSNISGWTAVHLPGAGGSGSGTWAWDNTIYHSPGGSLKATADNSNGILYATFSGDTFLKDRTYVFRFWARQSTITGSPLSAASDIYITIGDVAMPPSGSATAIFTKWGTTKTGLTGLDPAMTIFNLTSGLETDHISTANQWEQFEIRWTAPETYDGSDVYFAIQPRISSPTGVNYWYDDFTIYTPIPTLLDRLGRSRTATLAINSPLTTEAAKQLGDVFLSLKSRTPFRGSWKVQGDGRVRSAGDGAPRHPAEMLLETTELVRFLNIIDPDTGGVGRDGVIDTVSYSHDDRSASVSIDNTRNDFEALLARLAAVTQARTRY